jgi:clan AA aspartic protease
MRGAVVGTFSVLIEVASRPEGPFVSLQAVVDTGAFYSWIPASTLRGLGAAPQAKRSFVLADGRTIERDVAQVLVRLDGQDTYTWCVFGDEGTEPLVGAYTLEGLALTVDPINQRLVPMPRLYMLMMQGFWMPRQLGN